MQVHEILFHRARLIGVTHDGNVLIPLKPICDAMHIDWPGQYDRVKRHPAPLEGIRITRIPFRRGGTQIMVCLPLQRIHLWLATIDSTRIKDRDTRHRVVEYQKECADVLFAYFMPGYAKVLGIRLPTFKTQVLQNDLFDDGDVHIDPTGQRRPFGFDFDDDC
jgi:hypothetical protein